MAGRNPKLALDAFVGRLRRTIQCVARAEAFGSGYDLGRINSIALVPHGGDAGSPVTPRTEDGRRDLLFAVSHHYSVVHLPDDRERGPYNVSSAYYSYEILDREEREILLYQWHPEGVSDITFPHLHIPRMNPIAHARRAGTDDSPPSVAVGEMHLPTQRIVLEDVVELLFREFNVEPQRDDWQDVLRDNREAVQRGRT